MANHCNSYGFSGGFAAICAAISWYLVQEKTCKISISHFLSDTFSKSPSPHWHSSHKYVL